VNQSVAGWATVFLASGFWLKRLLANQTFFGFQRPRHSGNRSSNVGSPFVIYITALLTAKNVALISWLEHLTTLDTWPWLNRYRSLVLLVVAPRSTKPLILTSGHKEFAATFTGNLDFRLSDFVAVSGSVLFLQLVSAFMRTSLVAARLAIKFLATNHTLRLGVRCLYFVLADFSANFFFAFGQKL
jgi:hypothetical protein